MVIDANEYAIGSGSGGRKLPWTCSGFGLKECEEINGSKYYVGRANLFVGHMLMRSVFSEQYYKTSLRHGQLRFLFLYFT